MGSIETRNVHCTVHYNCTLFTTEQVDVYHICTHLTRFCEYVEKKYTYSIVILYYKEDKLKEQYHEIFDHYCFAQKSLYCTYLGPI